MYWKKNRAHLELAVHALGHGVVDGKGAHRVANVGRVQQHLEQQQPVRVRLGVILRGSTFG